jgi:Insertion element 4 transposase N-terminal/Transposase DDE domain
MRASPSQAVPRLADQVALGVLTRTYPPALVDRVLAQTGRVERRHRLLPARLMVYYVLGLALFSGIGSVEVLRCLVEGLREQAGWRHPREPWRSWHLPAKSALIQARARLGPEPLRVLFEHAVGPLATPRTRGAWYRGWRVMSLDGTCLDVPDTPANAGVFGRPGSSRGERAGAFPQVRLVGLAECGTHAVVAAALGPYTTSEAALADELLETPGRLGPELLVLTDRGLWGADRWRRAVQHGAALVWRVKTGPTGPALPAERVLADGSWLARLTAGTGDPVLVRVLEYRLDDPGLAAQASGGRRPASAGMVYRLITSILDPEAAPAVELAALYHQRWEIETTLDELKVHQRGPGAVLRSKTPNGVCQEVWAHLLVHYALRALMHDTAVAHDLDPDRLSFTATLRIVRRHTITRAVFSP